MKERFLLPQVSPMRFVHELPLVELCNGLVAGALDQGFDRLEVLAPDAGAVMAEIRAYRGRRSSPYFALPVSMHQRVVRRMKAMAKMRRIRPPDTRGVIRFAGKQRRPIEIAVRLRPRADGQADVIMTLPERD